MGGWTFLDYFFLLIILISTGFAVTKGLMRELVSLVALIGGFLLAAFHYPRVGAWFGDLTRTETIANLLGFLVIFLGVLLVGAIVAFLANRFVKMATDEPLVVMVDSDVARVFTNAESVNRALRA